VFGTPFGYIPFGDDGSGGTSSAPVIWYKDASHPDWTTTGAGLIATKSGNNGLVSVKGSLLAISGYCEFAITTLSAGFAIVGFDDDFSILSDWPGDSSGVGFISDGRVDIGGATQFTGSTFTQTDIIGLCLKAGKFYCHKNNVWQNSSNPSAGTGGLDVSSVLPNGGVPTASFQNQGMVLTANFGASAFIYPIPLGVSSWDGSQSSNKYRGAKSRSLAYRGVKTDIQLDVGVSPMGWS
jgi:hypothetical protein